MSRPSKKSKKAKVKPLQRAIQMSDSDTLLQPAITVEQALEFLENYRSLIDPHQQLPSKLISIKIQPALLKAFRIKAESEGVPYQTKIKQLMKDYLHG